jgi:hypothetical protein
MKPEQSSAESIKQRTLSDAEFVKGGARYLADEEEKVKLKVTDDQIEGARAEMQEDLEARKLVEHSQELKKNKYKYNLEALSELRNSVEDEFFRSGEQKVPKPELLDKIIDDVSNGHYYQGFVFNENFTKPSDESQYSIEFLKDLVHNYLQIPEEKKEDIFYKISNRIDKVYPTDKEKKHLKQFLYGIIQDDNDLEAQFVEKYPDFFKENYIEEITEIESGENVDPVEEQLWLEAFDEIVEAVLRPQEQQVLRLKIENPDMSLAEIAEQLEPLHNRGKRKEKVERFLKEGQGVPGLSRQRVMQIESKTRRKLKRYGFGQEGVSMLDAMERVWGKEVLKERMLAKRELHNKKDQVVSKDFEDFLLKIYPFEWEKTKGREGFSTEVLEILNPKGKALMLLIGESWKKVFEPRFLESYSEELMNNYAKENLEKLLAEGDYEVLQNLPITLLEAELDFDKYFELIFGKDIKDVFKASLGLDDGEVKASYNLQQQMGEEKENYFKQEANKAVEFTRQLIADYSVENFKELVPAIKQKEKFRLKIFNSPQLSYAEKSLLNLKFDFSKPGNYKTFLENEDIVEEISAGEVGRERFVRALAKASAKLDSLEKQLRKETFRK